MAQIRSFEYQDLLLSEVLNDLNTATLPAGVYAGYDYKHNPTNDGSIILTVDNSLIKDDNGVKLSVLKMPNGVTVIETADINPLPITANGTLQNRCDAVIVEHQYLNIRGGEQAVYSIIEGQYTALGSDLILPALSDTDAKTKLIIGYLLVPPLSFINQSQYVFTKSPRPSIGNSPLIERFNRFKAMQADAFSNVAIQANDPAGKLDIPKTANVFYLTSTTGYPIKWLPDFRDTADNAKQRGITVKLIAKDFTFAFEDTTNQPAPAGYKPIKTVLGSGFNAMDGDVNTLSLYTGGSIDLLEEETYWRVVGMIDEFTHPNFLSKNVIKNTLDFKNNVLGVIHNNPINPYDTVKQVGTYTIDGSGNLVLSPNGQLFYVNTTSTITGILRGASALAEGDVVTVKFLVDGAIVQCSPTPIVSQFVFIDAINGQNAINIKANDFVVFEQTNLSISITNYPKRLFWQTMTINSSPILPTTHGQPNIQFAIKDGEGYLRGNIVIDDTLIASTSGDIVVCNFPTGSVQRYSAGVIQNFKSSLHTGIWGNTFAGTNIAYYINADQFVLPREQFTQNAGVSGYNTFYLDNIRFSVYN